MKKIKSILIASAIVAIAGTLFAFTKAKQPVIKENKPFVEVCFQFNGSSSNVHDPSQYATFTSAPSCPTGTDIPCIVGVDNTNSNLYDAATGKPKVASGTILGNAIDNKVTSGTGLPLRIKGINK